MKKILYISVFVLLLLKGSAQQTAQYSQYIFNHFGHHPSLAGWRDCMEFRLGIRTQWVKFPGAPKTAFANFNTVLNRKKKGYLRTRHGVGANVENDQMGPFGITRLYLAYAYHVPLNRRYKFSMGLYAGIEQFKMDVSKITLENYRDPAITGNSSVIVYPEVWPSLFLYSNDFYIGATLRQMLLNRIKKVTVDGRLRHEVNITSGKRFKAGRNTDMIPSVCLKWTYISAPALDINFMFDFNNRFMLGASWRNTDALVGMARINLGSFSLGYAFDFTTSKIKYGSSNTHEVILGINTCKRDNRNSDECPVFN